MTFDPSKLSYTTLLEFFYRMHDPTTKDRQGGDRGTQYRSAIFYHSEEQEKQAREVTKKVQEKWWKSGTVTTEILPAGEWWDAEAYHQRYLEVCSHDQFFSVMERILIRNFWQVNPGGYECPAHYLRSFSPLD